MLAQLRPAIVLLILLTVITGLAYPARRDRHRPGGLSATRRTAA